MSTRITSRAELPAAPYYVLANDACLSGWGLATGKINTVLLPCDCLTDAKRVADNARSRTDMRRVRVVYGKPRLTAGHVYSLMSPEQAPRWYGEGFGGAK